MTDRSFKVALLPTSIRRLVGIKLLFLMAFAGLLAGLVSAYVSAQPVPVPPPAFSPAANPYARGIYANGIVESLQAHGSNISIFPEVPGPVTRVFVSEGDHVKAGQPLVTIDDFVQRQTTEQQKAQMAVAAAQIQSAQASFKTVADTYAKQQQAQALDPQSISRDVLDTEHNALMAAEANLVVARSQYTALVKSAAASEALLRKYTIRTPQDGIVMSLAAMTGSYVSTQGAYDPYTQGYGPIVVMGTSSSDLEVRCYVDEILIGRLAPPEHLTATMYVRGTNTAVPLVYERMQPYVSPKIQLSDQRLEQVDVRVLPIIFRFRHPPGLALYPGQLVDVYIANRRRDLAAMLAVMLASGCTVGPDFQRPSAPASSGYVQGRDPVATATASGVSQQLSTSASVPDDWWRLFDCTALNDAVRDGLTNSPSTAAARANLQQARDELQSGEGIFYPQLGAAAGAAREHPSGNATPLRFAEGTYNLLTLTASVGYVLDIFGGERRTVEALGAQVDLQRNASRAASLTLAANIANTLIAIAAYRAEISATAEIVRTEQNQVRLAHVQAVAGTGTYAAELTLQSQLETTQAGLPALEQQLAKAQHLLAMLEGHLPSTVQPSAVGFSQISLPRNVPLSLPSDLVRQRPDILVAEAAMHSASAQVGVATAALFPSITLNGSVGYSAISSANLFSGASNVWSLGAGVTQPIFNGGSLWFRKEAAKDALDAADAQYRQTVLQAFQQVADTLRALEHDAQALSTREQALRTSGRALKLAEANYKAGLSTYSDLLLADEEVQQAEISETETRAERYQDTVALFVSLGGGWWNQPNSPEAGSR